MADTKSRLVVITTAIVAVLWALTVLNIFERHSSTVSEAHREVATLARTLEVQAVNSIGATDLLLRVAIQKILENDWLDEDDQAREAQIRAYLQETQKDLPQVLNLVLFYADGRFRAQSAGPVPQNVGPTDAEHYAMLAANPDLERYVSHAFRGRLTDRLIFSVARRIRDEDGAFVGLLVAGIDPNYFNGIYASLDIGQDGVVALFDNRGVMVDRFPKNEARPAGRSFIDRPLFTEHLPRAPQGTYMGPPQPSGQINIIGYRRIEGSPLIITVAESRNEVLAPWREDAWRDCLTMAVVTLLLVFGCTIMVREVNSRRLSQRSLKFSEERFRNTFDHAPVGIAQLDLEGHWLMTNPALRDMLGYSDAELRLTRLPEITAPEDRATSAAAWDAMIRGDLELYTAEKRYIRRDGQPLWVNCTATLQKSNRGKPRYILLIIADISSRKAMDADLEAKTEQLRQSEEISRKQALILESVITSMADAVMVADEHNRFVLVNPAAHQLYGVRTNDSFEPQKYATKFGLHHLDKQTPLTADQVPLLRALRGESVDSAEVFVRNQIRPEGVYLSISARPMRDQTGAIRGGVVVCRDITGVRQTNDALRQAQKMEAVGQLTGGIAHDFNNLLQVIIGNNEILAEGLPDNSRQEKLAHMTLMAARRGAELTSQLLSFSRRQALQPRPTDIVQLIGESEGLMQRAGGASIAIKRVFAPELWHAVVDPGMLQTALLNLVFNARDAMPDGGRITFEAENIVCDNAYVTRHGTVRSGEYVRIAVSDSGTGIPADLLERVFEPFFTTKGVGKGSGLGLSMVYGFAQQSNGAVRIESTEGKGTTVYLYLPRSAVEAPSEIAPPPRAAVPRGSETILVVEDDPLVREFAVGALRGLGYTVLAATDGDAALHCLRIHKDPVHLLFSDVVMPGGITGWQLAEIATAMRPSLKVLLTSGYAEGSAGPGRDNTAFGSVLAKPYGKNALASSVRGALAAHQKVRVH